MSKSKNIEKAERCSLNIKAKLLESLRVSVPEVFSEGRVNWDKIRLALGECIEAASEKFNFTCYYDNLFEYDPDKTAEENDKAFKDYLNKAQKELFPVKINEIDIVYENIIKEGLSLNARIDEIKIGKNKVYKAADSERKLLICLDEKLSAGAIDALTDKEYKEKIFICFDAALTDSDKANLSLNLALKTI